MRKFTKYPSGYIKASKNDFSYLALFNGEILEVFNDFDEAKAALKSEIDSAIADGNADGVDFGECWIETNNYDEEVMYIADGDDDYADYI
jgi:hypothetical protein